MTYYGTSLVRVFQSPADVSTQDPIASPGSFAVTLDPPVGVYIYDGAAWQNLGNVGTSATPASEIAAGIVELATSAETTTGTDNTRAVHPAGLAALIATDTLRGLVELATNAEAVTGTDTTRATTPAGVAAATAAAITARVASDIAAGIVELATTAETTTGTDATRAVTPASLMGSRPTNAYCELTRLADQNITDGTFEDVLWNSETRDPRGWHSTVSLTERVTPDVAGMYNVSFYSIWTASATGIRRARIKRNATLQAQESIPPPTGNTTAPQATSFQVFCNGTTDYITVDTWQNTGGILALGAASTLIVTLGR